MDFDWLEDLKRERQSAEREREHLANAAVQSTWRVDVCAGRSCSRAGSKRLRHLLLRLLNEDGLLDEVEVRIVGCRDRCDFAPSWDVYPGPTRYCQLSPPAVRKIVSDHLASGRPVESLRYHPMQKWQRR